MDLTDAQIEDMCERTVEKFQTVGGGMTVEVAKPGFSG